MGEFQLTPFFSYHSAPVYSAPVYNTSSVEKPTAPVYETTVVPEYTTYCPEPTHVTYGSKVYTVTEVRSFTHSGDF